MSRVQSIQANILNVPVNFKKTNNKKVPVNFTSNTEMFVSNPLKNFLDTQAALNKTMVKTVKPVVKTDVQNVENAQKVAKVEDKTAKTPVYKNNLRTMMQNGEAKILAIIPRTFNAKDENGDEKITGKEKHGTFLNAIDRLDEIKEQGFNTFHILSFLFH